MPVFNNSSTTVAQWLTGISDNTSPSGNANTAIPKQPSESEEYANQKGGRNKDPGVPA